MFLPDEAHSDIRHPTSYSRSNNIMKIKHFPMYLCILRHNWKVHTWRVLWTRDRAFLFLALARIVVLCSSEAHFTNWLQSVVGLPVMDKHQNLRGE